VGPPFASVKIAHPLQGNFRLLHEGEQACHVLVGPLRRVRWASGPGSEQTPKLLADLVRHHLRTDLRDGGEERNAFKHFAECSESDSFASPSGNLTYLTSCLSSHPLRRYLPEPAQTDCLDLRGQVDHARGGPCQPAGQMSFQQRRVQEYAWP
jgi:hypothetical protein